MKGSSKGGGASAHGTERVRQRLGLPAKAVDRAVRNALARGTKRTEFSGSLRRYLDLLWHKGRERNAADNIIVYGQIIYLFAGDLLVTTWPLPPKYRNRKAVLERTHAEVTDGGSLEEDETLPAECGFEGAEEAS